MFCILLLLIDITTLYCIYCTPHTLHHRLCCSINTCAVECCLNEPRTLLFSLFESALPTSWPGSGLFLSVRPPRPLPPPPPLAVAAAAKKKRARHRMVTTAERAQTNSPFMRLLLLQLGRRAAALMAQNNVNRVAR
jgi:hypothetical protein